MYISLLCIKFVYNDLLSHAVSYILSIHVLINDLFYTHSGEHYVFMKGVIVFMTFIDVTGTNCIRFNEMYI